MIDNLKYIKAIFETLENQYQKKLNNYEKTKKEINTNIKKLESEMDKLKEEKENYQKMLDINKNKKEIIEKAKSDTYQKIATWTTYELRLQLSSFTWEQIANLFLHERRKQVLIDTIEEIIFKINKKNENDYNLERTEANSLAKLIWRKFAYYYHLFFDLKEKFGVEITSYSNYDEGYFDEYDPSTHNKVIFLKNLEKHPKFEKISEGISKKEKIKELQKNVDKLIEKINEQKVELQLAKEKFKEEQQEFLDYILNYQIAFTLQNLKDLQEKLAVTKIDYEKAKQKWIQANENYLKTSKIKL